MSVFPYSDIVNGVTERRRNAEMFGVAMKLAGPAERPHMYIPSQAAHRKENKTGNARRNNMTHSANLIRTLGGCANNHR